MQSLKEQTLKLKEFVKEQLSDPNASEDSKNGLNFYLFVADRMNSIDLSDDYQVSNLVIEIIKHDPGDTKYDVKNSLIKLVINHHCCAVRDKYSK